MMKVSDIWFGKLAGAAVLAACLSWFPLTMQAQLDVSTNGDGTVTIVGNQGGGGPVMVPSTIDGRTVTGIGPGAFESFSSPTSISLPATITNIAPYGLAYCSALRSISVSTQNPAYTAVNNVLFSKDQSKLVQFPEGVGGAYTIPTTVHTILQAAFAGASMLTSVSVPATVTNIQPPAFQYCTLLTSITVDPANPRFLSTNGVVYDKQQQRLVVCPGGFTGTCPVPATVTTIDVGAFNNVPNLTAIQVDPNNTHFASVDGVLFDSSMTTLIQFPGGKGGSYKVPEGVLNLFYSAFANAGSVTNIIVSDGVSNIPVGEYEQCASLQSITIGNGVTNIDSGAFGVDRNLASVSLGTNVHTIGSSAFFVCSQLGRLVLPASVTNIGVGAFVACDSLQSLDFLGDAPPQDPDVGIYNTSQFTIYYLPGTAGWGTTFDGRPAVMWNPVLHSDDGNLGVQNNAFGFNVTANVNAAVVVEAASDMTSPAWTPVATNNLATGSYYFSDPQWVNSPARYYRLRMP